MMPRQSSFFFFNDTATTEIYTLSLHDALPISTVGGAGHGRAGARFGRGGRSKFRSIFHGVASAATPWKILRNRSEEHTSELQSLRHLVCRLLLEKKKKTVYVQNVNLA